MLNGMGESLAPATLFAAWTCEAGASLAKHLVRRREVDLRARSCCNALPAGDVAVINSQPMRPLIVKQLKYDLIKEFVKRDPDKGRIQIDLSGNPLSKMTLEELRVLDNADARPLGPIFKLPELIELDDGTRFQPSQPLVRRDDVTASASSTTGNA